MTNNCIDFDLSQVSSIKAYKVSDATLGFPVYADRKVVSSSVISGFSNGAAIKFERESVSVNDSEAKTVAGSLHTVKVSWEMQRPSEDDYALLAQLRHNAHYLVITCFGNVVRLIATGMTGYDFKTEESDGKQKCTMTLRNGQGIIAVQ